jgi:hypothetical protein
MRAGGGHRDQSIMCAKDNDRSTANTRNQSALAVEVFYRSNPNPYIQMVLRSLVRFELVLYQACSSP